VQYGCRASDNSVVPRRRPTHVQRQEHTVEVLNAIYAGALLGFSDGFQPGRSPHDARDAVPVGIETRAITWVLDADMRGCLEAIDHAWLRKVVAPRPGDRRVIRHIRTWRKAGVREAGPWRAPEAGTPPGGSGSPVAAHIALHSVLDRWAERWRRREVRGAVMIVRSGDDCLVGFEHRAAAERFWAERQERFQPFHLELHPEKTRLLECGR